MNRTIKRCLLGLVASTTMFGIALAQSDEPVGTVQVGPNAAASQPAPTNPVFQFSSQADFPPSPATMAPPGSNPSPGFAPLTPLQGPAPGSPGIAGQPGPGSYQLTPVDQVMTTRFTVDSRGGGLYGYGAGYSNIGAFVPYKIDDTSLFFATGMGLITYDSRGGATVGGGYRHWMESLDRIIGLAGFFDFDNGHAMPYQQLGFSFESLGRYTDMRVNGYAPVGNATHVLNSTVTSNATLSGNSILLGQLNTIEQSYGGFDAEMGGPTPFLGRYGLNAYLGGYYFMSSGVLGGTTTGVSGRLLSQINEDVSFGVQVTDDHLFGLNTQFQVFVNLPNGRPSRWMRNLRVQDRLVQNVFRQNRVIAKEFTYTSEVAAIDPNSGKPYFVAFIDPNAAANGNGTSGSPFNSIAAYEAQSLAQRKQYDLILVSPGTATTDSNLNTNSAFASTLDIYNNQRLLSTSSASTIYTANLPGVAITIPGPSSGNSPLLTNSGGNNVVTLVGGNSQIEQVSGFQIVGNATGNGIWGINNTAVTIDHNKISGGLNGVYLQNLSGTIAAGTQANFLDNTVQNNRGNGVWISNTAPGTLQTVVTGNTFATNLGDGLRMDAGVAGSSISGVIGGANTAATSTSAAVALSNTFSGNTANGLNLTANGGNLNFSSSASGLGIYNNTFNSNGNNGLNISTASNSVGIFNVVGNTFGSSSTTGNSNFGIDLTAAGSSTATIAIGAANIAATNSSSEVTLANTFTDNAVSAINLVASGTANLNYNINNNTITNAIAPTTTAPQDSFTFTFDGTSGTDPFSIANTSSTAGVTITGLTWNLAGTGATFAQSPLDIALMQPNNSTDKTTGLTTVDGVAVLAGTNPLQITSTAAVANNTNLGVAQYTPSLSLGFSNFSKSNSSFLGTSTLEQSGGGAILTSAATVGSTVTATFSNGLTSTVKLTSEASTDGLAVGGTGTVTGSATPGYGSGSDGIHVSATGSATLGSAAADTSIIQNNNVSGYGGYGVNVLTANNAIASHVVIIDNTVTSNGIGVNGAGATFTGGGIDLSRNDSSTLNVVLTANTVTSNFNNGLTLTGNGTSTGGLTVDSSYNTMTGNSGNGLNIVASGTAATLNLTSNGDNYSNSGSAANTTASTGDDNIALTTLSSAIATITLNNTTANNAVGNGLSATTYGSSTLNLAVNSYFDPIIPTLTGSSFSSNGSSGVNLNLNDTSSLNFNVSSPIVANHTQFTTSFINNAVDGVLVNRAGASLITSTIANSTMSENGINGFAFHGLGSDPQDPTQPSIGTPNQISLISDMLNFNGNFTTSVGQGARVDLLGSSVLVLNASGGTTFDNNAQNGLRVEESPGAEFGYELGNIRSTFDNVSFNNNLANGVMMLSDLTPNTVSTTTPPPGGNYFLPYDRPSVTYMQISANTGNTQISNNGGDGMLLQFMGGHQDILVEGQGASGSTYTTTIQGNAVDGIHSEAGIETTASTSGNSNAGVFLTVENVTIGAGSLGSNVSTGSGNGGNGIDFEVQSVMLLGGQSTIIDGQSTIIDGQLMANNGPGTGTLTVDNSIINGNGLNGVNLIGNSLDYNGLNSNGTLVTRTTSNINDTGAGQLSANITSSVITNNKGDGVNILLEGPLAQSFSGLKNAFVLSNNTISNNGAFGVFMEQNAAVDVRNSGTVNQDFRVVNFNDPQPTTPPGPFNPVNLAGFGAFNGAWAANTSEAYLASGFMNLETAITSSLVMTSNTIQFNGKAGNLQQSDGVFLRIGTNSYLSADIQNNTVSGNVGNDFHIESFLAYNPATGVAPEPTGSVASSSTTVANPDIIVLDDSAQLDLRFTGNTGNSLNIQDPIVNSVLPGGTLLGNSTPNGAVYAADPLKYQYSFTNPSPRIAQIFEVDNGAALNSTNSFTQNGITTNVQNAFYNADYYLRTVADPLFPNPQFPQSYSSSPENPFLP